MLYSVNCVCTQEPALRTVGNIITGREQHVGLMLDNGVLENFGSLLRHQKANIQKVQNCSLTATNCVLYIMVNVVYRRQPGLFPTSLRVLRNILRCCLV